MAALTPRKMKEIDSQLREMKEKRAPKVFLTVFCDIKNLEDTLTVPQMVMDSIRRIEGIESVSYVNATNYITAIAQWGEYDVSLKVEEIKKIRNVIEVRAEILAPLF
jgi:hypothetical protein